MIYPGLPALIGSQFYGVKTRYMNFNNLDGTHYVDLTTEIVIETVECWVDFSDIGTNVSYFLGGPVTQGIRYNGTDFLVFNGSSGFTAVAWTRVSRFVHFAAVRNATNINLYDLYIDGELIGTANTSSTINVPIIRFGRRVSPPGNGFPFVGNMDEVRFWNHARSQEQIKRYMNTRLIGNPALHTGLVAYYPMDEGTGDVVGDFSQNNNNGTRVGATWITP
jgi:hypothetical protein